ncbi:anthranilate phosphoribosyltransferase family protein [Roseofilum sp. BLCC_M154]|uniref:Anthranilate phosphoribosyltransferase family protein n=1 Tax=Roseofilum acuticapitatum BLCC-M154 TaxID=3022444 RepID=A0ABT7AYB5_9CYAN|nr:anthranilate phosphoribosyltransferase family protein [Roseofilum acuticapitatum]MDJ1171901.1 anthranilate phosphoribosyltransferase family protein [Roseofilum acuticapitatum BLCC-M154]
MSDSFRELLKKVGSGPHTGKLLTRTESAQAARQMLLQEATPAQIGAFMIAHRMRRPTPEELAGILDTYEELGPKLQPRQEGEKVVILGIPYDGRSRFIPVNIITALMLVTVGIPVILHGGPRMPTKYGIPLIKLWQGLGVHWQSLSLDRTQDIFNQTGLGFIYLPQHFPEANSLIIYREQIGKRPPLATVELMWCPYAGQVHLMAGYVHPPTESLFKRTLALRGVEELTTIKGLEGSCDLPLSRTAILGLSRDRSAEISETGEPEIALERLCINCREYDFTPSDVTLDSEAGAIASLKAILDHQPTPLLRSAIWNGGFYLWRCGCCDSLEAGLSMAKDLLSGDTIARTLDDLHRKINH